MKNSRVFIAMSATAMAILVAGYSSPAAASPIGTTFTLITNNFSLNTDPAPYDPGTDPLGPGVDSVTPGIPFGATVAIPAAGVEISTSVSTSTAVPGLLVGGLDLIHISFKTLGGGFLNATPSAHSTWIVDGLNWGPGSLPGIGAGLIFLSWDDDGVGVPIDGSAFMLPVVPDPVTGFPALPLDISGDPVSTVFYDTASLTGATMLTSFLALGLTISEALGVNSMHVSFEVTHIPEPTSIAMLGTGLASVLMLRRRVR